MTRDWREPNFSPQRKASESKTHVVKLIDTMHSVNSPTHASNSAESQRDRLCWYRPACSAVCTSACSARLILANRPNPRRLNTNPANFARTAATPSFRVLCHRHSPTSKKASALEFWQVETAMLVRSAIVRGVRRAAVRVSRARVAIAPKPSEKARIFSYSNARFRYFRHPSSLPVRFALRRPFASPWSLLEALCCSINFILLLTLSHELIAYFPHPQWALSKTSRSRFLASETPERVEDRSQYVTSMDEATIRPSEHQVLPTYRVMDTDGKILNPKDDPHVRTIRLFCCPFEGFLMFFPQ